MTVELALEEPGQYTIEVLADGVEHVCTASLPLASCDVVAGVAACDAFALNPPICSSPPPEGNRLDSLTLEGSPASVSVTIRRDGMKIASQTFSPTYDGVAPNGVECGPICRHATVSMQ
jgi:hypothetical protein